MFEDVFKVLREYKRIDFIPRASHLQRRFHWNWGWAHQVQRELLFANLVEYTGDHAVWIYEPNAHDDSSAVAD